MSGFHVLVMVAIGGVVFFLFAISGHLHRIANAIEAQNEHFDIGTDPASVATNDVPLHGQDS